MAQKIANHRREEALSVRVITNNLRTNTQICKIVNHKRKSVLSVQKIVNNIRMNLSTSTQEQLFQSSNTSFSFGTKIVITELSTGQTKEISSSYLKECSITRAINSYASWNVTFNDSNSCLFSPVNAESEFYDWLGLDVFSGPWTVKRTWRIHNLIGDTEWKSPVLLPLAIKEPITAKKISTSVSGYDLTRNLMQPSQTLETQVSTCGDIVYSHEIIKMILEAGGIKHWDLTKLDEFPVRKMHLQGGCLIDFINQILEVTVGYWFFDGEVFVAFQPHQKKHLADWTYTANENIFQLDNEWSLVDNMNDIMVVRTHETAGLELFCAKGPEACGMQKLSLAHPRWAPSLYVLGQTIKLGRIGSVDWLDVNGKYKDDEGGVSGTAPWHTCQFIFYPDESRRDSLMDGFCEWCVEIGGLTEEEVGGELFPSETYNVHVADLVDQAKHGIWEAENAVDNPLIPNEDWATKHGERKIAEAIRRRKRKTFKTAYNPFIKPGATIEIKNNPDRGGDQFYFTESITLDAGSKTTTVNLSQFQS